MLTELLAIQDLLEQPLQDEQDEFVAMQEVYRALGGRTFLYPEVASTITGPHRWMITPWDQIFFESEDQLAAIHRLNYPWQTVLVDEDVEGMVFDSASPLKGAAHAQSPALFLDRDGVVIQDKHYLIDPVQIEIRPELIPLVLQAQKKGFKVILVTNQSGLGRGMFSLEQYRVFHAELDKKLPFQLDAHLFSPYWRNSNTRLGHLAPSLRKPNPGMITWAALCEQVDLSKSWLIGNSATDIEAAARAGLGSAFLWNQKAVAKPKQTPANFFWSEELRIEL